MDKSVEQQVAELVETVQPTPPMRPDRRSQALAAMEAAGRRPRRTWVWRLTPAAAVAVIAVIVAFVGSPARSARYTIEQVRERVLAAADKAETVHVYGPTRWTGRKPGERIDADLEMWADRSGFWRQEIRRREDGKLHFTDRRNGMERLTYFPVGSGYAHRYWDPEEAVASEGRIQRRVEIYIRRDFWLIGKPSDYQRAEIESRGAVEVLEAESEVRLPDTLYDLAQGERLRLRAEVDRQTGRLLTYMVYTYNTDKNDWQVKSESHYEWNVPIPRELRSFDIPEGTLEHRYHWWDTRADQMLAQKQTQNWTVTAHALDVNRDGAVYLSVSALPRQGNSAGSIGANVIEYLGVTVQAADERGVAYETDQERGRGRSYLGEKAVFAVVLLRPVSEPLGRMLTVTVHARLEDTEGSITLDEPVTFQLPLPPRQEGDDLPLEADEVVQH